MILPPSFFILFKKYLGYVFYAISIFLFIPFILNVFVIGIWVVDPEGVMTPMVYLFYIGEYLVVYWYLHVPAVILTMSGYFLNKKYE